MGVMCFDASWSPDDMMPDVRPNYQHQIFGARGHSWWMSADATQWALMATTTLGAADVIIIIIRPVPTFRKFFSEIWARAARHSCFWQLGCVSWVHVTAGGDRRTVTRRV